jgi:hypothetical protein
MLAARVEQKNGMTKEDKNGVIPIDKESTYGSVRGVRGNSHSYRDTEANHPNVER